MPKNIEIKARLRDWRAVEARAADLSMSPGRTIRQEDTFFSCRTGRLKLRVEGDGKEGGQLIFYERPDTPGPKASCYRVIAVPDPAAMKEALARALGTRGRVVKERSLFLVGATRIHLDRVEGLGDYIELEVVLEEGVSEAEGEACADDLMKSLGIEPEDLVSGAYVDLLAARESWRTGKECADIMRNGIWLTGEDDRQKD